MSKVKHQSYYKRNRIEVKGIIQLVLEFLGDGVTNYEAFCVANVLKYVLRYKFKGKPKEDLDKAKTYLEFLKEELNDK